MEIVPRTVGVYDGLPVLDDGTALDVSSVIWCTGYRTSHDWIDLPVLDDEDDLAHDYHGVIAKEPGLYRVGREFLYAFNSHTIGGVARHAERIVNLIGSRS